MTSLYLTITNRNGFRQCSSRCNDKVTLDVEMKANKADGDSQVECMTPPGNLIQDYYDFNQILNENAVNGFTKDLESFLGSEITKIYHQLDNKSSASEDDQDADVTEDEEEYSKTDLDDPFSSSLESTDLISPRVDEIGDTIVQRASRQSPERTQKTKTQKGLIHISAHPKHDLLLGTTLRSSSEKLASSYKKTQDSTRSKRSYLGASGDSLRMNDTFLHISNFHEIGVNDTLAIIQTDLSKLSPNFQPSLVQHSEPAESRENQKVEDVRYSLTSTPATKFLLEDHNNHNAKPEYPRTLANSDCGIKKVAATLDLLSSTAVHSAASRDRPNTFFSAAELETLQQRLKLSNPAPRPKHLVNKEEHRGLSPISAERAVAIENGHALPARNKPSMKPIALVGLDGTSRLDTAPAINRSILQRTASNASSDTSDTSVVHPHVVATQECRSARTSGSAGNSRSSSANSLTSRFATSLGGSPQGSRKVSPISPQKTIPGIKSKNGLGKPCAAESLYEDLDMPHYQLSTAQSRMRDVRNPGAFDSPTPAGRTLTPAGERAAGSLRQRRMSSGSLVSRQSEETAGLSGGRLSSTSTRSRRTNIGSYKNKSLDRADFLAFLKDDDKEYVESIPFSLDSRVVAARSSQNGRAYTDTYDGELAPKENEMDLKQLQIELDSVKKMVGLLQERIAKHIPESESQSLKPSGEGGNYHNRESRVETEVKGLLDILESNVEPSHKEIQRHLSNLSRGLEDEKGKIHQLDAAATIKSEGGGTAAAKKLTAKKPLEPATLAVEQQENQPATKPKNNSGFGMASNLAQLPSLVTVLFVLLTCVATYGVVCVYLFLIDYTEKTSTPF